MLHGTNSNWDWNIKKRRFTNNKSIKHFSNPLNSLGRGFFYRLITGNTFLGITNYFFMLGPITSKISTTQHLFTIPLAIFTLYLIKIKKNSAWFISFFQITLLFFISRLVTLPKENVNCVYHSCMKISFEPYYLLFWFVGYFVMILITNSILVNLPFLKERK